MKCTRTLQMWTRWNVGEYMVLFKILTSRYGRICSLSQHQTIANSLVAKDSEIRTPPPASASAKAAAVKPTAKPPVATQLRKEASTSSRRGSVSEDNASGRSTPQTVAPSATLKRSDSTKSVGTKHKTAGDIFKSFAKAKAKPKDAAKSNESTPAPVEDGKLIHAVFDVPL